MKIFKKGDRFTEMYAFWMYILKVTKNYIYTINASAPCTFPDDGKVEKLTRKEFLTKFYFVYLVDRGNDVNGWLKKGIKNE
jgi:hypothetical protein